MPWLSFHRVLVGGEVHAYKEFSRWTLCGLNKVHEPRVEDAVGCSDCINVARAESIRMADKAMGRQPYPEWHDEQEEEVNSA